MTTIATDGRSMAGDGQSDVSGTILNGAAAKVTRLSDGSLFGMSGTSWDRTAVTEYLENGGTKPKTDRMMALVLRPDGTILYFNEKMTQSVIMAPAAVGSGMDFAIGAMECGASPEDAVGAACRRDTSSGGKITVLHLETAVRAVA